MSRQSSYTFRLVCVIFLRLSLCASLRFFLLVFLIFALSLLGACTHLLCRDSMIDHLCIVNSRPIALSNIGESEYSTPSTSFLRSTGLQRPASHPTKSYICTSPDRTDGMQRDAAGHLQYPALLFVFRCRCRNRPGNSVKWVGSSFQELHGTEWQFMV